MNEEEYRGDGSGFNFATEILSDMKNDMREERQTTNKYLWRALFLVIFLWFATIGGFVWHISQYDYISYTQDGEGINNVNTGTQGDLNNGAESQGPGEEEQKAQGNGS